MPKESPAQIALDAGTHYWCSCGKSVTVPLCDGSHKGTGKEPLAFTVAEKKKLVLCNCQRTKNPPYCDGSHLKE